MGSPHHGIASEEEVHGGREPGRPWREPPPAVPWPHARQKGIDSGRGSWRLWHLPPLNKERPGEGPAGGGGGAGGGRQSRLPPLTQADDSLPSRRGGERDLQRRPGCKGESSSDPSPLPPEVLPFLAQGGRAGVCRTVSPRPHFLTDGGTRPPGEAGDWFVSHLLGWDEVTGRRVCCALRPHAWGGPYSIFTSLLFFLLLLF